MNIQKRKQIVEDSYINRFPDGSIESMDDADELWISKKSIMNLEMECMKRFPNETGKQNMSFRRKLCDKLRSFR